MGKYKLVKEPRLRELERSLFDAIMGYILKGIKGRKTGL